MSTAVEETAVDNDRSSPTGLWARVTSRVALERAWQTVLDNDQEDGVTAPSVRRYASDAPERLDQLADTLATGAWRPGDLTLVEIPKHDGGVRTLHIPCVADRIVARVVLDAVTGYVDPELGAASFAYRPGLGATDAVHAILDVRAEGLAWVARTDVDDCFVHIPRELAVRRLSALVPEPRIITLVERLGERAYRTKHGSWRKLPGVPQGCPLSPLLANLVLVDVDSALLTAGFPVVRYADDLAIFASTQTEAEEAIRVAEDSVTELGMTLGADKTAVMSFEDGFSFLGEDFSPRYPANVDRVAEPVQRALYVARDGGRVSVDAGRVRVRSKDNEMLLDVAQTQVSRIVCFGSVGLSSGARTWALANDIDIVLASRGGNYLGTMLSHEDRYRPARLRAQLDLPEDRGLGIAQAIITAKIRNQRTLLLRMNRRANSEQTADTIGQLGMLITMIPQAASVPEVMGLEGAAAKFYFPCYGALMPDGMEFQLRSRRPPEDVTNAALSFLYTVLLGECVTAVHAVGLEPSIGVLHADQENRPSLALDLMEEFRPLVVDDVVHTLAAHRALTPAHGRPENHGIWLTSAGREIVLNGYENRMLQNMSALEGFSGTLRRHLHRQAQRLRNAILRGDGWTGLSWR